eukprot:235248_1
MYLIDRYLIYLNLFGLSFTETRMAMETNLNFAEILKYSQMYNDILQDLFNDQRLHDESNRLFTTLVQIISPILIQAMKASYEKDLIKLFKKLVFSCFFEYYKHNESALTKHFKTTIASLQTMYIELQSKKSALPSKIAKKSQKRKIILKSPKYNNLFNDIPDDVLSASMSYIDALDLAKMEIISHKFLQCARAPIAINVLSYRFFDEILYHFHDEPCPTLFVYNNMKRYILLKNIHIKQNVLQRLMYLHDKCEINKLLSFIHLDENTVHSLYKILQPPLMLETLNMNVIRGLKYITDSPQIFIINITADTYLHPWFDDHFVWNNFYNIRKYFAKFTGIDFSLDTKDYDVTTRFLWLSVCCHENIEYLRLKYDTWYPHSNDYTTFFMENYKNIIPKLNKLKYLSLSSRKDDDGRHQRFIEDGKCFVDVLRSKIEMNTLYTIHFEQWNNSWCNIDSLKIWILNHYKTLNILRFSLSGVDFEICDIETWKPIILISQLIEEKGKYEEIDYWFNNVFKKFEFLVEMPNPYEIAIDVKEYIGFSSINKAELRQINVKINQCIRYFMKMNIEWNIIIDVALQRQDLPVKEEKIDLLSMYHGFFPDSHRNFEDYSLRFPKQSHKQKLIIDYV